MTKQRRLRSQPGPLNHVTFPVQQLEEYAGTSSAAELAALVRVSRESVHRWRSEGLNWIRADACAIALGDHPGNIWPDLWWIGTDAA